MQTNKRIVQDNALAIIRNLSINQHTTHIYVILFVEWLELCPVNLTCI